MAEHPNGNQCIFCGEAGQLTKEHVFGKWLGGVGLSSERVRQHAGPLNRSSRDLGAARPFTLAVRDVCERCNNGWMSDLEATAKRVLSPLILGQPGSIARSDLPALSAWAHKTALIAMRVSSKEERARGHGVPSSEYHALYAARDERRPSPSTQFWIGRYCGSRPAGTVWIAPMIVTVDGLEPPELPQAYVMTLLLGEVLLQGVRFATPGLYFDLTPSQGLARIWPGDCDAVWPLGKPVDDEAFFDVGKGLNLTTGLPFGLAPWLPATDLPASVAAGSMVELPTPCGEHVVYYPARLIAEASLGIFYWFVTACECDKGYLVRTDRNRVRFKTEGEPADIRAAYDELTGDELYWQDENGTFECKRIPSSREGVG